MAKSLASLGLTALLVGASLLAAGPAGAASKPIGAVPVSAERSTSVPDTGWWRALNASTRSSASGSGTPGSPIARVELARRRWRPSTGGAARITG